MAKIEVDGLGVITVPDTFKTLTKEEKQRYVNQIAKSGAQRERKKIKPKNEEKSDGDDGYAANLARMGGQGLLLGFGDEIEAGLRTGFGFAGDYGKTRDDIRENIDDFRAANPKTALAAEIGGGLLTGGVGGARAAGSVLGRKLINKVGTAGFGGTVGATEGAIAGVGAGRDSSERLTGGLVGLGLGGALGSSAPLAINAIGKGLNRAAYTLGLKSDDAIQRGADLKAVQALENANTTPAAVQQSLDDAVVPNMMIPDVAGEATRRLARGSATVSGEGADIAQKALDDRMAGLGDDIADDIGFVLGGNTSKKEALDTIADRQAKNAADDYDAAFNIDGRPASVPVTPEIKRILSLPAFDEAVEKAANLAKFDGVELPSAQRLIDGGAIDNLSVRELHYIKMGLDEVMGLGKRGASKTSIGRGMERGLKNARASFIDIIDIASPKVLNDAGDEVSAYKIARNKFAGDARLKDALDDGEAFFKSGADDIASDLSKLSSSEKEAFKIGVAQAIRNNVDKVADMADAGKRIFGSPAKRKQLRAAFDDDASFEAFEKRMTQRASQVKTRARAAPTAGSRTAPLQEDVANLGSDASAVGQLLMGNPLPTARSIFERATTRGGMPEQIGSALSRDLFSTNKQQQRAFLDRLAKRQAEETARLARSGRRTGAYGGFIGAGSGLLTGDR
jgi:hypothetical protein